MRKVSYKMVKIDMNMKEEKLNFFLKHIAKAVKVAKTFLVLKCTKKIKQLRDEGKSDEDEPMKLAAQLHLSAKSINQADLAKAIVYIKYPQMLRDQDGAVRMDDVNVQHVMASKQFQHAMSEIEEKWREHETKEMEQRDMFGRSKKRRDGSKSDKIDMPLRAAKLVGQKRGKERMPLGKAMFVDTLDSENAVVIGSEGDEEVNEVKRLKSLRNQRNRIVNRLKRDNSTSGADDMNIYLPVHLRNLPEPSLKKKGNNKSKANSSAEATDSQPDNDKHKMRGGDKKSRDRDHSWTDKPHRSNRSDGHDDGFNSFSAQVSSSHSSNDRKRKDVDDHDVSSPAHKRPKPSHAHPTSNQSHPAVVDIGLAAGGRHWQEAGIHPSWAAKQLKQQQAISIPPVGTTVSKKIVFDD